jgi:hypothetical protein
MPSYRAVMQSFDTTIRLAAIRQDELLQAAPRGRVARVARITRRSRRSTRRKEA